MNLLGILVSPSYLKAISVAKRLQLIVEEEGIFSKTSASTSKPTASVKRGGDDDLNSSSFFENYDKMSINDLYKVVKTRKMHYWNLANYFNNNFIKSADDKTKKVLKEELCTQILPIIKKADDLMKELENGNKPKDVGVFLKKEGIEVNPEVFWKMTKDERLTRNSFSNNNL